ncbi:DEAD-domain-containing protein [Coniophora puteana RWD-64-598 SS2]|uniref:DEAD-domain-containing protein n=1 Tax=Coniophora puteana (strain RWD-64-598) TaxID=741705 RepID=A0A5M3MT71_CONPW|nr:DEAD-domain-containing protein [Coniophora puteana RWD-64-598 SS2]EIW82369.1 DEAD-domain-containing protein [Coniophora puteana RWD-64-598 SS2]
MPFTDVQHPRTSPQGSSGSHSNDFDEDHSGHGTHLHKRIRLSSASTSSGVSDDDELSYFEEDRDPQSGDSSGDEDIPKETVQVSSRVTFGKRVSESPAHTAVNRSTHPKSFADMDIHQSLISTLSRMSIRTPTEIQAACIPPLLNGRDCIGNAQTGSGKTIAFAIPILQKLADDPYGIFALVLTPTRELAFQIGEQFAVLGAPLSVRTSVIVGGMDMMAQALELDARPHIVVATPGRMVDHLRSSSGQWSLARTKYLVLDEADRLLTATFAPELEHLFNILPKDRQTCLFTATLTQAIENLASASPKPGKDRPFVHRSHSRVETVATLKQKYALVPSHVRELYLYHILCHPPENTVSLRRAPPNADVKPVKKSKSGKKPSKRKADAEPNEPEQPPPTIIFCRKPRTAAYLTNLLKTLSIRSTALHSRLTQRERLTSLSLFRSFVVPVLVSTDVGARGLDIEDVAMVINWELPDEPEEYTHRVGRTARAGRSGFALSFVTEHDEERLNSIERRIGTQLEEMPFSESDILESLNSVSTAKRLARMELHDSNFGEREKIHKIKQEKSLGQSRSASGSR